MMKISCLVNTVFKSRTYIICNGDSSFWIVDSGDVDSLIDRLKSLCGSTPHIEGVLLTHAHFDHIYGLPQLSELFPDLKVYTNDYGRHMLASEKLNLSRYHDNPIVFESESVIVVNDGAEIGLFEGVTAKVYSTPGHNPSCLTYEVGDYLFTGDAYIPGEKVVTILPEADKKQAALSLELIKELAANKIVCPGHEIELNLDDT